MQQEAIRMYAKAVSFNAIKVYLSTQYYNGVSFKFIIKNIDENKRMLLSGDDIGIENGYHVYLLKADIELGKRYVVTDAYGLTCHVMPGLITQTKEFDEQYYYDGNDLGAMYTKEYTDFKVWSPLSSNVTLKLFNQDHIYLHVMKRLDKGVFHVRVKGDLDNYQYVYLVESNRVTIESLDPYAYASTSNAKASVVIDLEKVKPHLYPLAPINHYTDAIIYELGVRDFSTQLESQLPYSGKFLAFTKEGARTMRNQLSGIDYLEDLGVTHIQLMPINDFATVDEDAPFELYNWGYDPQQYNVTEGSFVTDPNDGYKRIIECQKMIEMIHKKGMRVILDVVYNHMHDVNHNALERTVPYYYFRRDENGLTNGTWCGNDFRSEAKMVRKYILDMCKRWQTLYGIDGYRMDLMGILDIDTVNQIKENGKAIDPSFMLYGEGWDMGTLPKEKKAAMYNHANMLGVGFFNDHFRDTMRGYNHNESKGYLSGDTYQTNEAIKALCNYEKFSSVTQSINYVECHDNATCYDKLALSNGQEDDVCKKRRCQLMLAATILAQGVPFIHSGQEFFDTKKGNQNSYNAGDLINQFDWIRKDEHLYNVEFVKRLIALRQKNPCFRYHDFDTINKHVQINNIHHRVIEYCLTQNFGEYRAFKIYFNPSYDTITLPVENDYHVIEATEGEEVINGQLMIKGVSMVICAK